MFLGKRTYALLSLTYWPQYFNFTFFLKNKAIEVRGYIGTFYHRMSKKRMVGTKRGKKKRKHKEMWKDEHLIWRQNNNIFYVSRECMRKISSFKSGMPDHNWLIAACYFNLIVNFINSRSLSTSLNPLSN